MKNVLLLLIFYGCSTLLSAQIIELSEVVIYPEKYQYMYQVIDDETDQNVRDLEMAIANFDVTKESYYDDEYDTYKVSFFIPEGYAVAAYGKEGKLLRTIERYKDVNLPVSVKKAIYKRFPNWTVEKDIYKVIYSENKNSASRVYKIRLSNGGKTMKVKTDEEGNFL